MDTSPLYRSTLIFAFMLAGSAGCDGEDLLPEDLPAMAWIDAGFSHTCGIGEDAKISCWGDDGYGQSSAPGSTFSQLDVYDDTHCGITSDGSIECWGNEGCIGSFDFEGRFVHVTVGGCHVCAIDESGAVECWGEYADLWH